MLDGRLTRLAILSLLLFAPLASGAPPASNRASADSADGQEITDMAADPTGQFLAAVVAFDNAKATGGLLPGSVPHDDVYLCDYGPSERPTSGSGCNGLRHTAAVVPATQAPNAPQRVAASTSTGGQAIFAVAGPGNSVTRWRSASATPDWTSQTEGSGYQALNVSISPNGDRVVVGTAPASPTSGGRIESRWGHNGTIEWFIDLTSPEGANVRPTSLDHSREGNILAIGTTDGVLFLDPAGPKPTGALGALTQPDTVSKVGLSKDGRYVVVGASNGVFLATLERTGGKIDDVLNTVYNSLSSDSVQDVAISTDGSRFAAAAGSRIHFFRRLETGGLAETTGPAYDVGTRITDIAYDAKGQILVVAAGTHILAFGPNKTTPIWDLDTSTAAAGAVDGPLRRVSISDDAQRILVAGKTKTMAYTNVIGVTAKLTSVTGSMALQPTQTIALKLTVNNTGSLPDNYTFSVVPPVGWTSTSADALRLDPHTEGTAFFNVTAPAGAPPSPYGVQVRVRSQATDDVSALRNQPTGYIAGPAFNLSIPRSVVLKVEAPDDRVLLRQGTEQTVAVTLRNEGNAIGIVNLSTRQELTRGASWDVRFLPADQVQVPASGSTTISVVIRAPSDAGSGDRNVITIRAREGETVEATDQIIVYTDAEFGAELRTNRTSWDFFPGQTSTVIVNVTNLGNTEDVYNLTQAITPTANQNDWRVTIETPQITVQRGETKRVAVTVKAVASDASDSVLNIRAQSQNSPAKDESTLPLNLVIVPRPPTKEDDKLLPAPPAVLALVVLGAAAFALRGGRR